VGLRDVFDHLLREKVCYSVMAVSGTIIVVALYSNIQVLVKYRIAEY
jgi:hypothetical protein